MKMLRAEQGFEEGIDYPCLMDQLAKPEIDRSPRAVHFWWCSWWRAQLPRLCTDPGCGGWLPRSPECLVVEFLSQRMAVPSFARPNFIPCMDHSFYPGLEWHTEALCHPKRDWRWM